MISIDWHRLENDVIASVGWRDGRLFHVREDNRGLWNAWAIDARDAIDQRGIVQELDGHVSGEVPEVAIIGPFLTQSAAEAACESLPP